MIRRIQGGLNHLGQRPGKNPESPEDSRLSELQRQLAQAIDQEEYEKAAIEVFKYSSNASVSKSKCPDGKKKNQKK